MGGVSGYPILLEGTRIDALVVGGGAVAWRKTVSLLDAGARVRVVASALCDGLHAAARSSPDRLMLLERGYASSDIGAALLVVAATDDRGVNARVAADATRAHRLVSVVDAPEEGQYVTPASYRADPLVIAVSAGGVPRAAARIRDRIAQRYDARYEAALSRLAALRRRLLASGDRAGWRAAEAALIDDQFCAHVEDGTFGARMAAWDAGTRSSPMDVACP